MTAQKFDEAGFLIGTSDLKISIKTCCSEDYLPYIHVYAAMIYTHWDWVIYTYWDFSQYLYREAILLQLLCREPACIV